MWGEQVLHEMRRAFPRKLWWKRENFLHMFENDHYCARLVTIGNVFAVFTFGMTREEPEKALGKLPDGCKVMHLYYLFLAPQFREQGHGYQMREDFIRQAKESGYHILTSFAKVGLSLHNVMKSGAEKIQRKQNFYGTGEAYYLTAMDL